MSDKDNQVIEHEDDSKELSVVDSQSTQVMNSLMATLESGSLTPESLTMVLDAQERILNRQAKQQYAISMAKCQGEIPSVFKNKWNDQTKSNFENIESLNNAIKPVYTKHGFAVSFNTGKSDIESFIRVLAAVSHDSGWVENFYIDLPMDDKGIKGSVNKTGVHGTASTRMYARRYLLKEIFNITTSDDQDDDGNGAAPPIEPVKIVSEDQAMQLHSKIIDNGIKMTIFMKWFTGVKAFEGCQSIDDLPVMHFDAVMKKINDTIKKMKETNN